MNKFIVFLLTAAFIYSEEEITQQPLPTATPQNTYYDKGHAIKEKQIPNGYNQQARIKVNGWNVYLSGSFIYWQGIEGGLSLAHLYPSSQTENNGYEVINMHFKYKPGFKVALGSQLGHDGWTLAIEYTWLHFSNTKNYSNTIANSNIAETWYTSDRTYAVNSKWKLRYDVIDLEMARPFYSGTCLTISPSAALRGGLIKQYYDWDAISSNYTETIYWPLSNNIQKSWLIGPKAGINCNFILFNYFKIISNAAMACFYQHFNNTGYVGIKYVNRSGIITPSYTRILTDTTDQLTANFDGALGLGWGSYFGDTNRCHFDISLLYELHYFFNQNKMYSLNQKMVQELLTQFGTSQPIEKYSPTYAAEDLMLHGLTLTARMEF
jgi:hypothetical protein